MAKIEQFRFNIREIDRFAVDKALEAARVLHSRDDEFRGRDWKGHALKAVADFFLEKIDPGVIVCIDSQRRTVDLKAAEAAKVGKSFSPKKASRIRQEIRDRWYDRYTSETPKRSMVQDVGRLYEAVLVAGSRYLADCNRFGEERDDFTFFERESLKKFTIVWNTRGGFLCQIRGDSRSLTDEGGRPTLYLWMSSDLEMPIRDEYENLMNDLEKPEVQITEIIPAEGADWDPPSIADSRLKMKG